MPSIKLSEHLIPEEKIVKIAEENPDLTFEMIKEILLAKQEAFAGKLKPYNFG